MNLDFRHITKSPKTTVVGLCVLFLAAARSVHFDATGHLAMSAKDWFAVLCGAVTSVVMGGSQDAGSQLVKTPEGVESAPSHEVPDDGAEPVTK